MTISYVEVEKMTLTKQCKALGSAIRVAIIDLLRDRGTMTVQDIADEFIGSPTMDVSVRRHLRILCDAGLCDRVMIGREFFYSVCPTEARQLSYKITELFSRTGTL